MNKLTITPIGNVGQARIELDGTDISNGVRGPDLKMAAGQVAQVTLDVAVYVEPVELDDPKIYLPEQTAQALEALGWVPPDRADRVRAYVDGLEGDYLDGIHGSNLAAEIHEALGEAK